MLTMPTWAFFALAVVCFTLPFWIALYSCREHRPTTKRNNYFDPRRKP